jgi:hypothetical protein
LAIVAAAAAYGCGSSAVTSVAGPSAARCQLSMTDTSSTFPPAGGTGSVSISVARECAWSAASQGGWIEITSAKEGQGDGTVAYRVVANGDPVTRRGAIVAGDQRVDIGQAGAPCEFTVSAPSRPLAAVRPHSPAEAAKHGKTWTQRPTRPLHEDARDHTITKRSWSS